MLCLHMTVPNRICGGKLNMAAVLQKRQYSIVMTEKYGKFYPGFSL
jgi:hypothetical protein